MTKLVEETKDLCKVNKPPKPLEYYFKIADLAFDFAYEYEN